VTDALISTVTCAAIVLSFMHLHQIMCTGGALVGGGVRQAPV